MTIRRCCRSIALALMPLAAACGGSATPRTAADTTVAATPPKTPVVQAGEVMASRHEAQAFMDSARAAVTAKDAAAAARAITNVASFTRTQANGIAEPARTTLLASVAELESLAGRASRNESLKPATLGYAFARTHVAEAQLHCVRGLDAWKKADAGAASSELNMLADHFERAATDANRPLTTTTKQAIATAREVAAKLSKGETVPPADVEGAFTAMDTHVHALLKTIANLKG